MTFAVHVFRKNIPWHEDAISVICFQVAQLIKHIWACAQTFPSGRGSWRFRNVSRKGSEEVFVPRDSSGISCLEIVERAFGGGVFSRGLCFPLNHHPSPNPPPQMPAEGPSPSGAARNPEVAPPTCGTGPASASVSLHRQEGIPINLPPLAAIPAVTSRR